MAINFTFISGAGKSTEYKQVSCFGVVGSSFSSKRHVIKDGVSPITEAFCSILYSPVVHKSIAGTTFLKDLCTTPGPIKTALDVINEINGSVCIDHENNKVAVSSRVPYKLALFALSIVRYLEERPYLIEKFQEFLPLSDSVTQAFLWANAADPDAEKYPGHSILTNYPVWSVVATSRTVRRTLGADLCFTYTFDVLCPPYNGPLVDAVATNKVRAVKKLSLNSSKQAFVKWQQKQLARLEEITHDSDNYTTA